MSKSLRVSLVGLLAFSCRPTVSTLKPSPDVDETTNVPVDSAVPTTDTGPEEEETEETGDTDEVETLPGSIADLVVSPAGGLFSESLPVSFASSTGEGVVLVCVASPSEVCDPVPVDGEILLTSSAIVYGRVDVAGIAGEVTATPFVLAEPSLLAYTSNLPVAVAWTPAGGADFSSNTTVMLSIWEPSDDRTHLTDTPTVGTRARMRIRGSSSAGLSKKNYDVELWQPTNAKDHDISLLGLPADGDWVFHAPSYFDDALMRNALGYQLSRDIGRYAPRTAPVEMFVARGDRPASTSDYVGVYSITEEIEVGNDRVDIAKLDETDVFEPEVSGGYIFKRDRSGVGDTEIYAGTGGGVYSFGVGLVPVDPESRELQREQVNWLTAEIDSAGYALAAANGLDPRTGRHFDEILDVDSFIDHHILNVLFKNPDAFRLSGYFTKDREGPILAGPLWDLDRTAGSIDSRATDPYYWDASNFTGDTTYVFTYGWYLGLFQNENFRTRYWARWQELLDGPLSEANVVAAIDALESQIGESGVRNNERWGAAAFSVEVANLRGWMQERIRWISACIDTHADPRTCAGR